MTVYVEDINDHAPQFVDAPYHVTVDELTPVGEICIHFPFSISFANIQDIVIFNGERREIVRTMRA